MIEEFCCCNLFFNNILQHADDIDMHLSIILSPRYHDLSKKFITSYKSIQWLNPSSCLAWDHANKTLLLLNYIQDKNPNNQQDNQHSEIPTATRVRHHAQEIQRTIQFNNEHQM